MDFQYSPKVIALQARLIAFMDEHIYPNEKVFYGEIEANRMAVVGRVGHATGISSAAPRVHATEVGLAKEAPLGAEHRKIFPQAH